MSSLVRIREPGLETRHTTGETVGRALVAENESDEEEPEEDDVLVCSIEFHLGGAVTEDEWRQACGSDDQLKEVMKGIAQGWSVCKSEQCEVYKHVFEELSIVNNVLMRADAMVVPKDLRYKVLSLGHEGHIGVKDSVSAGRQDQNMTNAIGADRQQVNAQTNQQKRQCQLPVLRRGLPHDLVPVADLAWGGSHCLVEKVLCRIPKSGAHFVKSVRIELLLRSLLMRLRLGLGGGPF
ncbi:hypothetical protein NDU88_006454 [Pleurodeles waltl]|uniref:Uncharacterized protein n=1 Tax=Pleurodeles waltl TaxID=8319 RepID=A0AAV7NRV2_PLEWA|nr:hypothetical protein NDU88_006454 [Pleurodeles waltl]